MRLINVLVISAVALMIQGCGFEIVDTGHRGIKTTFGKVEGGTLGEGIHFYNPFTSNVVELDVRERRFDTETTTYSSDAQIVHAKYALNFYPVKESMHLFYQNVGTDWAQVLIPQVVEGSLKEVFGVYKAVDLITHRQKAVEQVKTLIVTRLKEKDILLTNFELTDLDFDNDFEEAVKRKVIAVEDAKTSHNLMEKALNDKQIRITEAQAEAESMRIRANALKTNRSLVEYEAIQKWDGKLPTFMLGGGNGGAMPFINVNTNK